jgi:hypothetical protein
VFLVGDHIFWINVFGGPPSVFEKLDVATKNLATAMVAIHR